MSRLSRRGFVGLGAAGGAALLGGAIAPVAAAQAGPPFPSPTGPHPDAKAFPVPLVPGAHATTYGIADFGLIGTAGGLEVVVGSTPTRARQAPPGLLYLAPRIPIGATLARVDMYGYTDVATNQDWAVILADLNTGTEAIIGQPTVTGAGFITTEFVPSPATPLAPGQWYVVAGDTKPDTWIRGAVVQYLPPPIPPTPAVHPVVPKRVFDSRTSGAKLGANEERTISVATALDGSGEVIPTGATAVAITITVTETEGAGGFVSAFPAGTPWAGTSTVNWFGPGQNLATAAILALGGNRQLTLRGGVAPTHVVVDATAYVG